MYVTESINCETKYHSHYISAKEIVFVSVRLSSFCNRITRDFHENVDCCLLRKETVTFLGWYVS